MFVILDLYFFCGLPILYHVHDCFFLVKFCLNCLFNYFHASFALKSRYLHVPFLFELDKCAYYFRIRLWFWRSVTRHKLLS